MKSFQFESDIKRVVISISQSNDRILPQELWEAGSLLRVVGGELSLLSQTVKSDRFENRIHLSELRNVKTNIADERYTSVWGDGGGEFWQICR